MNKRNYQRELDVIVSGLCVARVPVSEETDESSGVARVPAEGTDGSPGTSESILLRPRLLLHSCCAPCSSYCIEYLSHYFEITLLYYNPNISPSEEYDKRVAELIRLCKEMEERGGLGSPVHVLEGRYEPEVFEDMATGLENLPEGGGRCYKCYELRMREAAREAADGKFDFFTTTLSISPLKNADWINEIGERLAEEFGVPHLPSDFKKKGGYQRSVALSKEYDLYRQNFCGCRFSREAAKA